MRNGVEEEQCQLTDVAAIDSIDAPGYKSWRNSDYLRFQFLHANRVLHDTLQTSFCRSVMILRLALVPLRSIWIVTLLSTIFFTCIEALLAGDSCSLRAGTEVQTLFRLSTVS